MSCPPPLTSPPPLTRLTEKGRVLCAQTSEGCSSTHSFHVQNCQRGSGATYVHATKIHYLPAILFNKRHSNDAQQAQCPGDLVAVPQDCSWRADGGHREPCSTPSPPPLLGPHPTPICLLSQPGVPCLLLPCLGRSRVFAECTCL